MYRPVMALVVLACLLASFAGAALRPGVSSQDAFDALETGGLEALESLRPEQGASSAELEPGLSQTLASMTVPGQLRFCGQIVPLDRPEVRDALLYELILAVGRPLMPMLWTRRAPGLLPMIEARLAEAGLPDDLKFVAMIESDLRPSVRSPAGALGLWQFMRGTAKRYGLTIDRYLDERKDEELATAAALDFLSDLQTEFGDWFLVAAAYNAGENRVARALADQREESYFDLFLPEETRRYVYRLLAAKLLYESLEDFGLAPLAPLHVARFRTVELTVTSGRADLRVLAPQRGLRYAELRTANPKILSEWLPRGVHRLRVPVPAARSVQESARPEAADPDA